MDEVWGIGAQHVLLLLLLPPHKLTVLLGTCLVPFLVYIHLQCPNTSDLT